MTTTFRIRKHHRNVGAVGLIVFFAFSAPGLGSRGQVTRAMRTKAMNQPAYSSGQLDVKRSRVATKGPVTDDLSIEIHVGCNDQLPHVFSLGICKID